MCFPTAAPKPQKPTPLPAPPNVLNSQNDALRRTQQMRAGGTTRQDTNVTGGTATSTPVYTPAAGGKTLLGS